MHVLKRTVMLYMWFILAWSQRMKHACMYAHTQHTFLHTTHHTHTPHTYTYTQHIPPSAPHTPCLERACNVCIHSRSKQILPVVCLRVGWSSSRTSRPLHVNWELWGAAEMGGGDTILKLGLLSWLSHQQERVLVFQLESACQRFDQNALVKMSARFFQPFSIELV